MKDTFHGWATVDKMNIDTVVDLIVTGKTAIEAKPDKWIYKYLAHSDEEITILDFGCGVGRNSFGFAMESNKWTITGYDNDAMLSKIKEFSELHYDGKIPPNLSFTSDWDLVKTKKFDLIICSLVLQHIYEDALIKYIQDFKQMTNKLIVIGRRYNDDKHRSVWIILEEQKLIPIRFYEGDKLIPYKPEGDPHDHNMAIYVL